MRKSIIGCTCFFAIAVALLGCTDKEPTPETATTPAEAPAATTEAPAPAEPAPAPTPAPPEATPEDTAAPAPSPTAEAPAAPAESPAGDTAGETGASPSPAPAAQTADASVDGQQVAQGVCMACHQAGLNGAPKFGDKVAWGPRIAQGKETLYEHAIKGFKVMPPKGGNTELSDEQVKAAVDYIVKVSGGYK